MRLYHHTLSSRAKAILRHGFRERTAGYGTSRQHSGVWLSDVPLDINEGADGDTLLAVDLALTEAQLAAYEWVEEGKGYREFLIPAQTVNRHSTLSVINELEE